MLEGYTIELDVHLTKDNVIVVYHDNNLKRLTGVDKEIDLCTYEEITSIIDVPTLKEVLDLVKGKVAIIVEIKFNMKYGRLESEVSKLLDNYNGKFAVQSFNPFSILWFNINRKNYIKGYLINGNYLSKFILNKLLRPDFVAVNVKGLDENKIIKIRKKYLVIGYTIKNNLEYNKYYDYADNFICDIGKEPYKRLLR